MVSGNYLMSWGVIEYSGSYVWIIVKRKLLYLERGNLRLTQKFMYNVEEVELVEKFRYIWVVFSCTMLKLYMKHQVVKVMFALLRGGRQLKLLIVVALDQFDKNVLFVLLYGCEVWGCTGT